MLFMTKFLVRTQEIWNKPSCSRTKLAELKNSKQTGIEIYPDGSKDRIKVAAFAVINKDVFSAILPEKATIFSAEAKAIELAFELAKMSKYTYWTIFLDSLSCLQSPHSINFDHPFLIQVQQILSKINILYNFNLKRNDEIFLKGEQKPKCTFCDCPFDFTSCIFGVFRPLPARNLLLNNVQTMQDLFTQVNISDILQFLQECNFYNKILRFLYLLLCPSDGKLNGTACQG